MIIRSSIVLLLQLDVDMMDTSHKVVDVVLEAEISTWKTDIFLEG